MEKKNDKRVGDGLCILSAIHTEPIQNSERFVYLLKNRNLNKLKFWDIYVYN